MQVHQAVRALAVADEGEKPVGEIGQKESAYDGRPKCNPDVLANARADKAAASVVLPEHKGREGLEDGVPRTHKMGLPISTGLLS
jgi:hypothetical protein